MKKLYAVQKVVLSSEPGPLVKKGPLSDLDWG